MRPALSILFFIPLFGGAQKLALIDRKLQEPIAIVDTITHEQVTSGILPVFKEDVSTIVELMQRLAKAIDNGGVPPSMSFDVKMGKTKCIISTEKVGKQYHYNIVLNTSMHNFKTSILLVDHEKNKRAAQRLNIFIDYLRNNQASISESM